MTDHYRTRTGESDGLNRRRVLETVGASAAALVGTVGSASAHKTQFFGCSQVCVGTAGDYAVVARGGSYHCRGITTADRSDRGNLAFEAAGKCYEIDEGAIVGVLEQYKQGGGTECRLCLNPNRCARNYYDDPADIVDALNGDGDCGDCLGNVTLSDDCTVYRSNGRPGDADRRSEVEDERGSEESESDDGQADDREHPNEAGENGHGGKKGHGRRKGHGEKKGHGNGKGKHGGEDEHPGRGRD